MVLAGDISVGIYLNGVLQKPGGFETSRLSAEPRNIVMHID